MQTATDASSFATTASRDEARNTEGPGAYKFKASLCRVYSGIPLQQQTKNVMLLNAPT